MSDELNNPGPEIQDDFAGEENDFTVLAEKKQGRNDLFRQMMNRNFLDYASYVIGSRAIPDVDDGLKPVQRRILWTLYQIYSNGLMTKSANVVGNTMHYHPHGDASIGDALTVLANKGGCVEKTVYNPKTKEEEQHFISTSYFIATEGNFGNILTGSPAAATRYTECSLTRMAHETMFNNDITELIPNYDGRKLEPVLLPAKLPSLLMMGSDGIAVGMSTSVLPHNFNELIDAEISELKGEKFQLFPDFQQGGMMDVQEYDDGNGKITLRAKIDIEGRDLVIREIPATTDTKSLMASIRRAWDKNKIKLSYMDDFTTDHAEIRITPTRGQDLEKVRQGLYMYTDCSVTISPKMVVICDRKPRQMTVTEVLKRNVQKLLSYLKREFEIELGKLNELAHAKTLAQLFFENRIYKRIEECKSQEEEYSEVFSGLSPFRDKLKRDITEEDIDKLLSLPVRRIARFDIEKNQQELRDIAAKIKEIKHHLAHLTEYTISYLENVKKEYGANFPRRTTIENIAQIDRKAAALNNIKIGWDRKNGYIGTAIKSDDTVVCNEFDRFVCVEKSGAFKVIPLPPEKLYIGKLYDFRRYDANTEFGIIYKESKTGKYYGKRSKIGGFILEKEYCLCPSGCKLELFTPRADAIYIINEVIRNVAKERELNLMELPVRSSKARGILITDKVVNKIIHNRYLTPEELETYSAVDAPDEPEEEEQLKDTPVVPPSSADNSDGKVAKIPAETVEPEKKTPEDIQEDADVADISDVAEVAVEETSEKAETLEAETVEFEKQTPVSETDEPEPADEMPEATAAEEMSTADTPEEKSAVVEPEPLKLSADTPESEKTRKRRPRIPRPVTNEPPVAPVQVDDDDFGIIQPEFGF